MAELIFPRRPDERISHDSRSSDAAKAWFDRSECADRSVLRLCAANVLRLALVLVSSLGALSVAAGNAHGQPTLPVSAQQESYAFGIDSLVFTVTRTGTAESEINDSVTLVQDEWHRSKSGNSSLHTRAGASRGIRFSGCPTDVGAAAPGD